MQALPLVTVMVGSPTPDQDVTLTTLSEDADEPRKIRFHLPTDGAPLSPGLPKWANYVKGVIHHYRGNPPCLSIKSFELHCTRDTQVEPSFISVAASSHVDTTGHLFHVLFKEKTSKKK